MMGVSDFEFQQWKEFISSHRVQTALLPAELLTDVYHALLPR